MLKPIEPNLVQLSPYIIPGLPATRKTATHDIIVDMVCDVYDIHLSALCTRSRKRDYVEVRQVIMYLLCSYTTMSLKKIAGIFGGYDHSTVIHSRKKINDLLCTDIELAHRIGRIKMRLHDHGMVATIPEKANNETICQ